MTTLLDTASAAESSVLDLITMAEDIALHTVRSCAEAFEPLTKRQPELPQTEVVPTAAEDRALVALDLALSGVEHADLGTTKTPVPAASARA